MTEDSIALQMRQALRRLAKAVVVITCRHDGIRYAMAATAVSELSMEPPSMLICVNKTASLHAALSKKTDFCINILDGSHKNVSAACGGGAKGEVRFETGNWIETDQGIPRLADAQASFVCRNDMETVYGSHSLFIGEVTEVFVNGDVNPLVYVDGRYTLVGADA